METDCKDRRHVGAQGGRPVLDLDLDYVYLHVLSVHSEYLLYLIKMAYRVKEKQE